MNVINDILDFSKMEAGQLSLDLRPSSITEIAKDVLEILNAQADEKNIPLILKYEPNIPNSLVTDELRIRQLLFNIIGNAIKFTKIGRIEIILGYDPSTSRFRCAVADTGQGIDQYQMQRLFKRFSQVDCTTTRHHGGTGLGLAICKGLVDMMGGEIGVDSVAGEGSTFWFEIPAKPAMLPAPAIQSLGDPLDGVRILVVDDQDGTRELVRAILRPCGAEISEARDGQEAVEVSALNPFDVILMDLRMPALDGIGATAAIRSGSGPNSNVPIVAFSADVGSKSLGDLGALGFDAQVAKPLVPLQLITTLSTLVFGERFSATPMGENLRAEAHGAIIFTRTRPLGVDRAGALGRSRVRPTARLCGGPEPAGSDANRFICSSSRSRF